MYMEDEFAVRRIPDADFKVLVKGRGGGVFYASAAAVMMLVMLVLLVTIIIAATACRSPASPLVAIRFEHTVYRGSILPDNAA
jgi:hypothetical protein